MKTVEYVLGNGTNRWFSHVREEGGTVERIYMPYHQAAEKFDTIEDARTMRELWSLDLEVYKVKTSVKRVEVSNG